MRIKEIIIILITFSSIATGGNPIAITTKITGFDEKEGRLLIESKNCPHAKYAVLKDPISKEEIRKIVEKLKGKEIMVFIEECKETVTILPRRVPHIIEEKEYRRGGALR